MYIFLLAFASLNLIKGSLGGREREKQSEECSAAAVLDFQFLCPNFFP